MSDLIEDLKLVREAKNIPKEVIEKLSKPARFQFARIRDDIEMRGVKDG